MAAACEVLGSNLAVDVPDDLQLGYETLKKLGLILSTNSTLTNWKDVAGKLGKSVEEIEGYYALRTSAGDPGYSVLTDCVRSYGRGAISKLCQVFEELELQSCLDEMKNDIQVQKMLAIQKQTERILHEPGSLDEGHKPTSLNNNSSGSCTPSESKAAHSLSGNNIVKPTSQSGDYSYNTLENTRENNERNDGIRVGLTDTCNLPSTSEMSGVHCACSRPPIVHNGAVEESAREGTSQLVSHPSFFRYVSCPVGVEPQSPPPSPPLTGRRGFSSRLFRRSNSVRCQRESASKGTKFMRFFSKRSSPKKSTKTGQSVTSERGKATAADAHMEPAEKQVANSSPVTNPSPCCSTARNSSTAAYTSSGRQTSSFESATCSPSTEPNSRRDSAGSEDSRQKCHPTRLERESGYSPEESEYPPSPLVVDPSKKIFIINHEDNREVVEKSLHTFFTEQGCECHLYQLEYSLVAASMPFKYMAENLRKADFVLICPSAKLSEMLDMVDDPSRDSLHQMDQSLKYALDLMVGEMGYKGKNTKGKYMPVLFNHTDVKYLPFSLQGAMKYAWPNDCNIMVTVMNGEQRLRHFSV